MRKIISTALLASFAVALSVQGAPNTRNQQVIEDRDKMERNDLWIYNDLGRAKQTASQSGRPMMVVFRCIP